MPTDQDTPSSPQEEASLVTRAREGDERAIRQLYRRHAPGIYGYLFSLVGEPAAADDLTSEVFLRALEGLSQFEDRGIAISAWLYRIAHDRLVDRFRRQAPRPTVLPDDKLLPPQDGLEQVIDARIPFEQVGKAMERLTEEQHQVILLRFIAGLKLKEIAYVMDRSTDVIRMLQFGALARLQQGVAQAI